MLGLAQLRLAQGQTDAAAKSIRRALDEAGDPATRCRVLPAFVEIMLAIGDFVAARQGADELAALAAEMDASFLEAVSEQASGAVLLAEGDAWAALAALRRAWTAWFELEAPYEGARVRVLVGRAYQALGDRDAADLEFDAARTSFERLGAAPISCRSRNFRGPTTGSADRA